MKNTRHLQQNGSTASHWFNRARLYTLLAVCAVQLCNNFLMVERAYAQANPPKQRVVFDSNRSGSFGIYSASMEGGDIQKLVDEKDWHEVYPDPSPDGTLVAYSRQKTMDRNSASEVWLVNRDGSAPRMLSNNGAFPTFNKDGEKVFFERNSKSVVSIDLNGGNEKRIFPLRRSRFKNKVISKPRISPDEKYIAFTSDIPHRWHAWFANLENGKGKRISSGCEPTWFVDQQKIAWVKKAGTRERSGIFLYDRSSNSQSPLEDADAPWGHEYFPTIAENDNLLLFSACPPKQHEHQNSNYQVFTKDLRTGERKRITTDAFNNRWPKLMK